MGRRDELIKTSGYRVSPTEVEEVVLESGLVSEAVVVGEPDEVAGHVVVVHCVPGNPTGFDPAALLTHCRSELPRHMVPRAVHVHGAFPRTPSGKVDRAAVAASSGWQELPSLGAVAPDAGAAGSGRSGRAPGPEALRKEVAS
ncbi:MAG: hypothetical protein M5U14_02655 [Acidimicrobiia bacterium]|nr:hypothetical protein [Acidimicrobiia bacterium]